MPIQEIKEPFTAFGVLFWFCWSVSRTETFTVLTSHKAAPHNSYQPHPAEPVQYTKCSNGFFVLLKMGIMMPETC